MHGTYSALQIFVVPDISTGLRSPAYWNLLAIGSAHLERGFSADPARMLNFGRAMRAENQVLDVEIDNQLRALEKARVDLETLKGLAARPGLPVVYDTNMLNHWRQPGDVLWREVFKELGEDVPLTRLVVPLRVVDELDAQKYGQGELAKKSATAIRYLERVLKDRAPGEPVRLRDGVTLEVWLDTDRVGPADLAILHCATDLAALCGGSGPRVLTADFGMRLRAGQMGLSVMSLPEDHRK